mmetsp:Transcript_71383/g.87582  ORF Transcript_71383/g.87582 Transcript_71383/m.87582 type:complete len:173 (-) Transcript_71383:547-1065(-)
MPRFYCDYCDVYLTHDSFSGRKQHMIGRKHQDNVRQYYMQFLKPGVLSNSENILVPGMGSVPVGITYPPKKYQTPIVPPMTMMQPPFPPMTTQMPIPGIQPPTATQPTTTTTATPVIPNTNDPTPNNPTTNKENTMTDKAASMGTNATLPYMPQRGSLADGSSQMSRHNPLQ